MPVLNNDERARRLLLQQQNGEQKTQIVDGSGNVIGSTSNALDVNISGGGGADVHVDDAAFTLGTDSGVMIMAFAGTQSVDANDAGALAMETDGALHIHDGGNSITTDNAGLVVLGTATYTEATSSGNIIGAVRNNALATLVNNDNEIAPLQVNALGALYVDSQPFSAVLEGGLTELIGINEQVAQNEYSGSIGVALGGTYSGELLNITIIQTEDDAGAILGESGVLFMYDVDPTISSGDTAMSAANGVTVVGKVNIVAGDWTTDANTGIAHKTVAIGFHAVSTLYFAYKHTGATTVNSGGSDDEQFELQFWYRRDS